jgi:hypothetical protein
MAFSLIYPQHNATIQQTAIVFGQLSPDVLSVTGRMISYTPSAILYAVRMDQLAPKFWRLVFVGLDVGDKYDLEILDQKGKIVATANNLTVAAMPANVSIDYPSNNATACPDLIAVGTTTQPNDPLQCLKVVKGTNVYTGSEDLRLGNVWSAIFSSIPEDVGYTLQIGHMADGSDADEAVIDIDIAACSPTPDTGQVPGPGPGPGL